jgi:hypothetical protein
MLRLVRHLALGAALLTVAVAVWRDYGTLITLKRALSAYLITFFVTGILVCIATLGVQVNRPPAPPPEPTRRERRKAAEAATAATRAARDAELNRQYGEDAGADAVQDEAADLIATTGEPS